MYLIDFVFLNKQTYETWCILKDNYIDNYATYDSIISEHFNILNNGDGELILKIDNQSFNMIILPNQYSLTEKI